MHATATSGFMYIPGLKLRPSCLHETHAVLPFIKYVASLTVWEPDHIPLHSPSHVPVLTHFISPLQIYMSVQFLWWLSILSEFFKCIKNEIIITYLSAIFNAFYFAVWINFSLRYHCLLSFRKSEFLYSADLMVMVCLIFSLFRRVLFCLQLHTMQNSRFTEFSSSILKRC